MNKEQEFAQYIANYTEQGKQTFQNLDILATFPLKNCKQFQPFNWLTLKEECALLNISVSLDLKNNIIIAAPTK